MRLGRTRAVALAGLDGALVDVEAHISCGLPTFVVTGLPDKACGQAPDRVRSAALSADHPLPPQRVVVNLSPASIPKVGTGFDLAIAVAVLSAAGTIDPRHVAEVVHVGELALDGSVRPVRGVLPAVLAAARAGVRHVVVAPANAAEARLVDGVVVHAPPDLATLVRWYAALAQGCALPVAAPGPLPAPGVAGGPDLADVVGQQDARAALELAAAGSHNLHMCGPPGAGKTMLARRLVTILPPLTREEALQTHAIRSLTGGIADDCQLDRTPPFVAPHHSASVASIVGGGSGLVLPGAVSRAHLGVLFLDEAPEFRGEVLQTLRQPLESGDVVIARAKSLTRFPARFQLVLASNPCPCGRSLSKGAECTCTSLQLRTYRDRLTGPLMDRVDINIQVPAVPRAAFADGPSESSAVVAARVLAAREAQRERWGSQGWTTNAQVPGSVLRRLPWRLPRAAVVGLERSLDEGRLTLRGYDRVLRLAWTAADLGGRTVPDAHDVLAGLSLRESGVRAA